MVFMLAEAFLSYDISQRLFDHALQSVAGFTLTIYDQVSTGDLLNRFGADIANIDGTICGQVVRFAMFAIILFTSVIAVLAIAPSMILVSVIVSGFVVHIFCLYQPASQKLRKLERSSYGPVLSQLSEIIDGAATIRAFNAGEHMRKSWSAALDTYQNFDYHYFALQSWLAYRIDMLTACSECVLVLLAIYHGRSASTVAVGSIIARDFVGALELTCRSLQGLQTSCFSVGRIQELIQLEQKPKGTVKPDDLWPRKGAVIVYENVSLGYADNGAPAIRNISLKLEHEQVIALVGRTGSGKTTLLQFLLGILSPISGRISIDGIDLTQVDKSRLRRRVSYIAQDPVLFTGTIRENIDPLQEFTDATILQILTRASPNKSWTLETNVEPGGSNFSLGERQIINLARAILRKSDIVLLDEGTAAIDSASEEMIQRLIRTKLKDSRIISITHRKEMMASADRMIGLANGEIVRDRGIGRNNN